MTVKLFISALLAIHCSLAFADGKFVIFEEYMGTTLGQKSFTFPEGEIVTVSQTRNDSSLVESVGRRWATQGGVWVPTRILASKQLFKPVASYTGEKHIEVGGGDFNAEYDFDTSGRFKYHETGSSTIMQGRLYQFKNIIWARIKTKDEFSKHSIFKLAPDGRLLYPIY